MPVGFGQKPLDPWQNLAVGWKKSDPGLVTFSMNNQLRWKVRKLIYYWYVSIRYTRYINKRFQVRMFAADGRTSTKSYSTALELWDVKPMPGGESRADAMIFISCGVYDGARVGEARARRRRKSQGNCASVMFSYYRARTRYVWYSWNDTRTIRYQI